MAEAVIRTQLIPVDAAKGYPQWGRLIDPVSGAVEFTANRQPDSIRFRETHGGFESGAAYEIQIMLPGFPEPFVSRVTGDQLNMGDPTSERQANYTFAQIGQLPLYFKITTTP